MIPWWRYLALATFVLSAIVEIIWLAKAQRERRPIGLAGLLVSFYLIVLYTYILWFAGNEISFIRNGMLSTIGTVMLALLHIADIIARPRK